MHYFLPNLYLYIVDCFGLKFRNKTAPRIFSFHLFSRCKSLHSCSYLHFFDKIPHSALEKTKSFNSEFFQGFASISSCHFVGSNIFPFKRQQKRVFSRLLSHQRGICSPVRLWMDSCTFTRRNHILSSSFLQCRWLEEKILQFYPLLSSH